MNLAPNLPDVDLFSAQSVYFVGIKGVGMTALAVLLQNAGVSVAGADVAEQFVTDETLAVHRIRVDVFGGNLPADVEAVVYSGAHKGNSNPLVEEARQKGIACVTLAEAVGLVSQKKETIAVCGVGGKSTTSALLSWMLETAGWKPSYAVGVGTIPNLGSSARWQEGAHFVVEADEYVADPQVPADSLTPRFLSLSPKHGICTSLAYDHPDVYASFEETVAAFRALFAKIPAGGKLVVNGDIPELVTLAQEFASTLDVILVGEGSHNTWRLSDLHVENGASVATLSSQDERISLRLPIPGFHNLRNAAYATVLARALGVPSEPIQASIETFRSTTRRFELVGKTKNGMRCYDDYAHHPRELQAISDSLTDWFSNQTVLVCFQPHTYSRTKALFAEFVEVLEKMPGELVLLPIFSSAREQHDPTVSSDQLAHELQNRGKSVRLVQNQQELLEYIQAFDGNDKLCITLGAGDIYKVYEHLDFPATI
jgi:UDP-N-acetylmuramate--alanine ligase